MSLSIVGIRRILDMYQRDILSYYPLTLARFEKEQEIVEKFQVQLKRMGERIMDHRMSPGHMTVSAWLISTSNHKALIGYHRKIQKWIPLGGHIENSDSSLWEGCLREIEEESGIPKNALYCPVASLIVSQEDKKENSSASEVLPFDLDIHDIAQHAGQPQHQHYDVRFLVATSHNILQQSSEVEQLLWVDDVRQLTSEYSTLRQHQKAVWWLSDKRGYEL